MRVRHNMLARARRIPLLIAMLFAADLILVVIPVLDYAIGRPLQRLSILFMLWATGLWPFVVGIPAIAVLAIVVRGARHVFLTRAARSLVLLIVGLAVMFTGAVVVELGANLLDETGPRDVSFLTQVVVEELMEMLGGTLVVWSAASLLHAYGFRLQMPGAPHFARQRYSKRSITVT